MKSGLVFVPKDQPMKEVLYDLYPRAAYYALKEAHQLNPYAEGINLRICSKSF